MKGWYSDDRERFNAILEKLSDEERAALAGFAANAYKCGTFEVLALLNWYSHCQGLRVTVEDTPVPLNAYEEPHNDFIGRCADWVWPDEREKQGE